MSAQRLAEAEQRLAALVAERGEERRRWDEARAQYEAQRRADARRAAAEAAELRAEAAELRDHLKQERSEVYKLRDVAQVLRLFFVLSFCRFPFFLYCSLLFFSFVNSSFSSYEQPTSASSTYSGANDLRNLSNRGRPNRTNDRFF